MAITTNANRIRVESAAKNGTLGSQAGINADQIKFDTNVNTNNGNLEASPSFQRRLVVIRRGEADEEQGAIRNVTGGVTCTMQDEWEIVPVSGDTYDVGYSLGDITTLAGCDFETDSRQWAMTKRLIVGDGTNFAYFGMGWGQILRFDDRGPSETALRVNNAARFEIGTIKNDKPTIGGVVVFDNDASDETVAEFINGSVSCLYNFVMMASRRPDGINGLLVTVGASATTKWSDAELYGVDAPFKRRRRRLKNGAGDRVSTAKQVRDEVPSLNGWCISNEGDDILAILTGEADSNKFRIVVEDQ